MGEWVRLPDELYHHGVKGMKWGVRRYVNSDGSLTPEGRAHYQKKLDKYTKKKEVISRRKERDIVERDRQMGRWYFVGRGARNARKLSRKIYKRTMAIKRIDKAIAKIGNRLV